MIAHPAAQAAFLRAEFGDSVVSHASPYGLVVMGRNGYVVLPRQWTIAELEAADAEVLA
jgi:hypothetical protein